MRDGEERAGPAPCGLVGVSPPSSSPYLTPSLDPARPATIITHLATGLDTMATTPSYFKTTPLEHQLKAHHFLTGQPYYALLMEQGTGKTKVAIDDAARLALEGEVDAMLVVAPNKVHINWVEEEFPKHMVLGYRAIAWNSGRAGTKASIQQFHSLLSTPEFALFSINIDALTTVNGRAAANTFLRTRRCVFIIDESTDIGNPSALRTKAVLKLSTLAPYRRILTGTPTAEGPFKAFSQFRFLHPDILGTPSYTAFKNQYAIFRSQRIPGVKRPVPILKGYRNLERLQELIAPYSYRVLREECLDLPPKSYVKWRLELSPQQRRHYDELRDQYITEMDSGEVATAPLMLTRMMRLQQIASGHVGITPGTPAVPIPGPNPRLEALMSALEYYPGKTIIWSRFTYDIDAIMEALPRGTAVRYDGQVSAEESEEAKNRFQSDPSTLYFVGNQQAGGRGITLNKARNVIYYANSLSLEKRLQSEDRAHRIGLEHPVLYIDLMAEDTIDQRIINMLVSKQNISDLITGDPSKVWIE